MRVFVTGASGYIGSSVVPALINARHEVIGLARSDESAAKVVAMGASVARGGLGDLDVLASAAADADATIHLAFDHETMMAGDFAGAVSKDLAVARAIGDALVGTDKAFYRHRARLGRHAEPARRGRERDLGLRLARRAGGTRRRRELDAQRPRQARLHTAHDPDRARERRVRLPRRGHQPLGRRARRRPRPALCPRAGEGAGRSATDRRR